MSAALARSWLISVFIVRGVSGLKGKVSKLSGWIVERKVALVRCTSVTFALGLIIRHGLARNQRLLSLGVLSVGRAEVVSVSTATRKRHGL